MLLALFCRVVIVSAYLKEDKRVLTPVLTPMHRCVGAALGIGTFKGSEAEGHCGSLIRCLGMQRVIPRSFLLSYFFFLCVCSTEMSFFAP